MQVNKTLKQYIENNIFPSYQKNDLGHDIDHIKYVIKRSMNFASMVEKINYDMVYVVAAYHDIGHYIDAKNHEKISSQILLSDQKLKDFFTEEQIKIMSEAVYDHRAHMKTEPRNIYGKIVSSADRNTLIDVILKRTYAYRIVHSPNSSLDQIIEESRKHIIDKFGKKGYATNKIYFEDLDYQKFLHDISILVDDKEKFTKKFIEINDIKRCKWCNLNNLKYIEYHDKEWGILNTNDDYLFEMLILESFQAGLSWECILNKRDEFKKAYDNFNLDLVCNYNSKKIKELLNNEKIIRNKLKIEASINNAKKFREIKKEYGSFYNYLLNFTHNQIIYETNKTTNELSDKISLDLKKRGMKFVGSTIIYSYLQAIGIIYSHDNDCFMHKTKE